MKYLKFTTEDNQVFEGKKEVCRFLKIGNKHLDLLISKTKYCANLREQKEHIINCKGHKLTFILLREALGKPKPEGKRKYVFKEELKSTYKVFKDNENHVFEYSCNNGKLIMTFTKERFEQILNKFFMFVDARYQV